MSGAHRGDPRPTHVLSVIERDTKNTCKIGVAWQRDDGSFHIRLSPCTTISWGDDVIISLFPVSRRESEQMPWDVD